jgi:hypothetical protein
LVSKSGWIGVTLAGLALPALSGEGQAQTLGTYDTVFTPACDSGRTMPVDTATVTVVVRPAWNMTGSSRKRARLLAQVLANFFEPPTIATLPQPQGWYRRDGVPLPGSGGTLQVDLSDSGRISALGWTKPSESPELMNAVTRALEAAGTAGALSTLGKKRGDSMRILLAAVDRAQKEDQSLMQLKAVYYPLEHPAEIESMPTADYPDALRPARAEGWVDVTYVVGVDGRVVPSTLRTVSFTHAEFVEPARDAILQGRFRPARSRGCRLSQLVAQRVSFATRTIIRMIP